MGRHKEKDVHKKLYSLSEEEARLSENLSRLNNMSETDFIGFLLRNYYYNDNYEKNLEEVNSQIKNKEKTIFSLSGEIKELEKKKDNLLKLKIFKEEEINKKLEEEKNRIILLLAEKINKKQISEAQSIAVTQSRRLKTTPEELLIAANNIYNNRLKRVSSINEITKTLKEDGLEKAEELSKKIGKEIEEDYLILLNEARKKISYI